MACGCRKNKPVARNVAFLCLDCKTKFTVNTSGSIGRIGNRYFIRGVNKVPIKHCSTNVKML